jgi:hypothetical protein
MESTIEEMLVLIRKKIAEQGAYDREAYRHFVGETIEYFRERGKLSDDENEDYLENALMNRYQEVRDDFLDGEDEGIDF